MALKGPGGLLEKVRAKRPLVHHITNYVTVNDCANITLAIGASPVMAHADDEVQDMVCLAQALVLNIGTLDRTQLSAMSQAGGRANQLGIPIVLDPVGAGATQFRTNAVRKLLQEIKISVLKGNGGEISVLAGAGGKVLGVDSAGIGADPIPMVRDYAKRLGTTVALTGPQDIISDGKKTLLVDNGHPLMGGFSGSGCMAGAVIGAFIAVSSDHVEASAAALAAFGLAGERAAKAAKTPFSMKQAIFDELFKLSPKDLERNARIKKA